MTHSLTGKSTVQESKDHLLRTAFTDPPTPADVHTLAGWRRGMSMGRGQAGGASGWRYRPAPLRTTAPGFPHIRNLLNQLAISS